MNKEDFCKRMRISETEFDIKRNGDFEIEDMERSYNFGKEDGIYACCRDGYLAGAEPREKRIAELEKKNAELKDYGSEGLQAYLKLEKQLTEAKDLIRNLLRVTYGEGWNYSLDWKVKAEQFLKESE